MPPSAGVSSLGAGVGVVSAGVSVPPQAASESTMARHSARANAFFIQSLIFFSPFKDLYPNAAQGSGVQDSSLRYP